MSGPTGNAAKEKPRPMNFRPGQLAGLSEREDWKRHSPFGFAGAAPLTAAVLGSTANTPRLANQAGNRSMFRGRLYLPSGFTEEIDSFD